MDKASPDVIHGVVPGKMPNTLHHLKHAVLTNAAGDSVTGLCSSCQAHPSKAVQFPSAGLEGAQLDIRVLQGGLRALED